MCAVSVITDYGMRTGVQGGGFAQIQDFMGLVRKARAYDEAHGEPKCEAPDKAEFLARLEKRLTAIEHKLGIEEED